MPLFMDRHDTIEEGTTAADVAQAHMEDLKVQDKYNAKYITYWFNYEDHSVFCLVDAPDIASAEAVHKEAHGLEASDIIEVGWDRVQDFFGKIHEPAPGEVWEENAFRTIMFTDIEGSTALTQSVGDDEAMRHLRAHNEIIRSALDNYGGRQVKHTGDGIMASFPSVAKAVECSIRIQRAFQEHNHSQPDLPLYVRIGMSAGEPVQEHEDLFGATVQLARRICDAGDSGRIFVSNVVRELCLGKAFKFRDHGDATLKGFPDPVRLYEVHWHEA